MLFSHDDVAKAMTAFECAWVNVRAVPRVTIDFGDGRVLKRTLQGNIATYFCTADGKAFDLVPGLVDAQEFLARLELARGFHDALRTAPWPGRLVRDFHTLAAHLDGRADGFRDEARKAREFLDFSKSGIEGRIKRAMAGVLDSHAGAADRAVEGDSPLAEDTRVNRAKRYPLVHKLLAGRDLATPAELMRDVYRDILNVDLDDPYLGLAPYVLGGEGGRE